MVLQLKKIISVCVLLLGASNLSAALMQGSLPTITPPAPQLAAKSYILVDYTTQQVLAEQNAEARVEPASLTKMMTVYVIDHALKSHKLKLTDAVSISEKAWKMPGSRMFVEVNTSVDVSDLLQGIIVQSGNDASVAMAEYIAGSESAFADLMNHYAQQLGMHHTHFANATGLPDPNHYTSARDMATLASALIRDFPESYKLYAQKEFIYKDIKQPNRNRLLWRNEWVDGIKTGHTDTAGFCLVASGKKDEMRLISVVMGTNSDSMRVEESNKLLTYGFRFFETKKLYAAATVLKTIKIWKGHKSALDIGLSEDLYVTIPHGQYPQLKASMDIQKEVQAPIQQGAVLGTLTVQSGDKPLIQKPLIALDEVSKAGIFARMYDTLALALQSLLEKVMPH